MTKKTIAEEIAKITTRGADGKFVPVDLSLEGVNKWRVSMGLEPLVKLPSEGVR